MSVKVVTKDIKNLKFDKIVNCNNKLNTFG